MAGTPHITSLRLLRHIARWQRCTFPEEEVLHMPGNQVLRFLLPRHESIFVENHLHPVFPQLPGLRRDVLEDALTQLSGPRRRVEPRQLLLELRAEHLASALVRDRLRRWIRGAGVSHNAIVTSGPRDQSRAPDTHAPGGARVPPRRPSRIERR